MVIWNIFFLLVCIPTAGKIVDVFNIPVSVAIFYFPFVYIIADILTEVYGYAAARRALWYTLIAQTAAMLIFQGVVYAPPSVSFAENAAFQTVLSSAPQIVIFGTVAVFLGDIVNNFVLAKMKVWTKGRNMAARFVVSTALGQLVNTAIFFIFGLWGFLPIDMLLKSILTAALLKTLVEIIMLPVTIKIVKKVKEIEGVDYFDKGTDFNPLKI